MNWLITGGTGSLGTALTARLCTHEDVDRVVCFSRDEYKQAQLQQRWHDERTSKLRFFLGDVRDRERLTHAMHRVDVVVHAAALKRVDAGSYNPAEMVKTNILGTMNVVEAAWRAGVGKVLVVSSDKAVEPMNCYGMTKACAEQYAVNANSYTHPDGTGIAVVRYGNVIGSRGSVVEKWRALLTAHSSPLTVKAADCTRFWLTLSQACDFILKVVSEMEPGCIYVPKLKASPISTMAEAMGLVVYGIEELRAGGEKIAEKLLSTDELSRTGDLGWCYEVAPSVHSWPLSPQSSALSPVCEYSSDTVDRFTVEELKEMLQ